jgi:polar amino acid transport system permease protein
MRVVIPPLGNEFNNMLKVTSLLSVIGLQELFLAAQDYNSATFRTFEIFLVTAIYYIVMTTAWSLVQAVIERRLQARGGDVVATVPLRQRLFSGGASGGGPAIGAEQLRGAR